MEIQKILSIAVYDQYTIPEALKKIQYLPLRSVWYLQNFSTIQYDQYENATFSQFCQVQPVWKFNTDSVPPRTPRIKIQKILSPAENYQYWKKLYFWPSCTTSMKQQKHLEPSSTTIMKILKNLSTTSMEMKVILSTIEYDQYENKKTFSTV